MNCNSQNGICDKNTNAIIGLEWMNEWMVETENETINWNWQLLRLEPLIQAEKINIKMEDLIWFWKTLFILAVNLHL